jgi:hypothetical protein
MAALAYLRKLLLGETWVLPLGIAAAVFLTEGLRLVVGPGGGWPSAAGFVLLIGLLGALTASLPRHAGRVPESRPEEPDPTGG